MPAKVRSVRECAMDYLARREHSRKELQQKLRAKSLDDQEIEAVLDRLQQQGLQSDQRFVDNYIHHRIQSGYGPRRIEQELAQKGVDHAMIAAGLQGCEGLWTERLRDVWQRKFGQPAGGDVKRYNQQYRFLLNRGFDPEQIREVLTHAVHDIE
ncbi:MAG: regulatory protein RecX [Coxiellaceae bacterium]|nr:regulatory protein RecX [Coxiellaceae bacterium]